MRNIEINLVSTTKDGNTFDFEIECSDSSAYEVLATLKLLTQTVNDGLIKKIKELNLMDIENEEERQIHLRSIRISEIEGLNI